MRIIFKILAAPFVLVLTLLVAVLSFLLSLSAGLLSMHGAKHLETQSPCRVLITSWQE